MTGDPGSRLSSDQRRRNRHFIWTMLALLTGFALAFLVYQLWHLTWLAVVLVAASAVLRWVAMLLADAYPPTLRRRRHRTR